MAATKNTGGQPGHRPAKSRNKDSAENQKGSGNTEKHQESVNSDGNDPGQEKKPKHPGGRPTKYKPEYSEIAKALCARGATDPELAEFFKVTISTVSLWKVQHAEFSEALKMSKGIMDDKVERSLLQRALGYEVDDVDIRVVDGEVVKTPVKRRVPPDTTACIFWLKNRRPKEWRDRTHHLLTGANDGPIQTQNVPVTDLSDEELMKIAAKGHGTQS